VLEQLREGIDGMATARGLGLGLDRDETAVARYAFS
jgi:hypothetical protein